MKNKEINPVQELSFLSLRIDMAEGEESCICTLDLNQCEIEVGDDTYLVGVKRAILQLDFDGFDFVPETRFSINNPPSIVETKRETSFESTVEGTASGSVGISNTIPTPKFEASGSASAKKKSAQSQVVTDTMYKVQAKGGARWEIKELESETPLSATYLNGEKMLQIVRKANQNRYVARATVWFSQKDLIFKKISEVRWYNWRTKERNEDKLLKLVAAKCIAKEFEPGVNFKGRVMISAVECIDEGL